MTWNKCIKLVNQKLKGNSGNCSSVVVVHCQLSLLSQEIGWEERLKNDLFYVEF